MSNVEPGKLAFHRLCSCRCGASLGSSSRLSEILLVVSRSCWVMAFRSPVPCEGWLTAGGRSAACVMYMPSSSV